MFPVSSLPLNLYLLHLLYLFNVSPSKGTARPFFRHSLWHIIALLGLAAYHIKPQQQQQQLQQQQQQQKRWTLCPVKLLTSVSPLGASLTATEVLSPSSSSITLQQQQQQQLLLWRSCPLGTQAAAGAALLRQHDAFSGARQFLSVLCPHEGLLFQENRCPFASRRSSNSSSNSSSRSSSSNSRALGHQA